MGKNDATNQETVMRFTRPHQRTRSRVAKLWVLTMGIGFLVVLSAPAANAGCQLLGCLTETLEDVTGVVEETAQDVVEVVDHTVDEGVDLVDDTLEVVSGGAEETVEETPKLVGETVEDTPKLVDDTVDDVTGSEDLPVPVSETDPGDEPVRGPGPDRSTGQEAPISTEVPPSLVAQGPVLDPTTAAPTQPRAVPSDPPGLLRRIGEAAALAARQLSFPLALSVIVVAFVLFQNYLDRKDPKLAVAPIAADVMKFE